MTASGFPEFLYTAEHIDFSQFEKGKLVKYTYFWTTATTDEAIDHYLKLVADKFLPADGQRLIERKWGRSRANTKKIIVRCVYEVTG